MPAFIEPVLDRLGVRSLASSHTLSPRLPPYLSQRPRLRRQWLRPKPHRPSIPLYHVENRTNPFRPQLIGLPAYSYSYYVTLPFTQTTCTDGTKSTLYNYATSGSTCGNLIGFGEQYLYRQLVANGWFKGGSVRRTLDSTSQTWVIYQPSTGLFIPTETTTSAWAKARYAFTNRLAGVNMCVFLSFAFPSSRRH